MSGHPLQQKFDSDQARSVAGCAAPANERNGDVDVFRAERSTALN
jgi:hypothetical protein